MDAPADNMTAEPHTEIEFNGFGQASSKHILYRL